MNKNTSQEIDLQSSSEYSTDLLDLLSITEAKLKRLISDPEISQGNSHQELLKEVYQTLLAAKKQAEGEDTRRSRSEQKRRQQALIEKERAHRDLAQALEIERGKLAAIIENLPVGVAVVDVQGNILSMNRASLDLHDFQSEADMLVRFERYEVEFEMRYLDGRIIPVENWPGSRAMLGEYIQDYEVYLRNKRSSTERIVSYSVTPIYSREGAIAVIVLLIHDLSKHKQAEHELFSLNQELEQRVAERTNELLELQRRFIDGIEAERTNLSRELHDGPMQDIYALSYRLALSSDDRSVQEREEERVSLQKELIQISQTLRDISQDLLPPTLAEFGIAKSIRSHIAGISQANPELSIHLDLQDGGPPLLERVRLALFRIYQTSIANVLRHAQAGQVTVRFYQDAENCFLEVEDDGVGFEAPQNWIELAREGHMGLVSARERAQSVGGNLEVQSGLGKGTRMRVVVPFSLAG